MTLDFNQELVRCIPEMERYARRLTRNAAAADDLVQDCLERALRNRDKFEPGTNLEAWLCTILKNLHFTNWKRERRVATVELEEETITTAPVQEHRIMLREVGEVVATLSADHHDLIRLVALHGDSYQDAAVAMGVSIGTIRSRLSRARSQLRAGCETRRSRRLGPSGRPPADRSAPGAGDACAPQAVSPAARRSPTIAPRLAPATPQAKAGGPVREVSRRDACARRPGALRGDARGAAAPPSRHTAPAAPGVSASRASRTGLAPEAGTARTIPTPLFNPSDAWLTLRNVAHRADPGPPRAGPARFRHALPRLSPWRNRSPPGLHTAMTQRTLLSTCVGLAMLLVAQLLAGL